MIPLSLDSSSSSRISCHQRRVIQRDRPIPTHLHRHHHLGRPVEDLLYRAIVAATQLSYYLDLVHVDLETDTVIKVDTLSMQDGFGELERSRRIHDLAKIVEFVILGFGCTRHASDGQATWWSAATGEGGSAWAIEAAWRRR